MMTRPEAEAIYDAGKETVVRVLLMMDARIHSLEQQVQSLTTRLDLSDKRVRHLEEQLAKNSRNSSKPPSTDGFKKPSPKSLRKKGQRKSGGQPGHTGHTLKRVENPDHTQVHHLDECESCRRSLKDQKPEGIEKRKSTTCPLGGSSSLSTKLKLKRAAADTSTRRLSPRASPLLCSTAPE